MTDDRDDFSDLLDLQPSENGHDVPPLWRDDPVFANGCYEVVMLFLAVLLGVCSVVAASWWAP